MKFRFVWVALLLSSSCSTPRYTYFFAQPSGASPAIKPVNVPAIAPPSAGSLTVSTSPIPSIPSTRTISTANAKPMERQAVSRHTVEEKATPTPNMVQAKPKMDADLKRSFIFVISGAVALVIGGEVFWVLGSLALIIGLIFGIKWLLRQ